MKNNEQWQYVKIMKYNIISDWKPENQCIQWRILSQWKWKIAIIQWKMTKKTMKESSNDRRKPNVY
jgi:hypothetical protein